MHTAMHDAVNGFDARYERHLSTLSDPSADAEAAAAAAAHKVLVNFFLANQAALDVELANSLSMIPDGPAKTAGVALGAAIGQEAFDARINDGFSSVDPFVPLVGVGFWKPTPPAFAPIVEPQFQNVTPFGIKSRDQFKVKTKKALILTHSGPPSNRVSGSAKRSASTPSSTTSGRWMATMATRTPTPTNVSMGIHWATDHECLAS
jgi:hypothetical protein